MAPERLGTEVRAVRAILVLFDGEQRYRRIRSHRKMPALINGLDQCGATNEGKVGRQIADVPPSSGALRLRVRW